MGIKTGFREGILECFSRTSGKAVAGAQGERVECWLRTSLRRARMAARTEILQLCSSESQQCNCIWFIPGSGYHRWCVPAILLRSCISMTQLTGSSCVYFQAIEHPGIQDLVDRISQALPDFSGHLAFDWIETPSRLVAIECNPRATSGIFLFSGTPSLANAITSGISSPPTTSESPHFSSLPPSSSSPNPPSSSSPLSTNPTAVTAEPGARRQLQVALGMLMWKRTDGDHDCKTALKEYFRHMKRLMCSRDVIFSGRDLLPSLMQPFLLTSYYEICRERKMNLPTMFQWDMT